MADKDTPNRSANTDKAEGERWSSEQGVIPNSGSSTERGHGDDGDNAGDVVNRDDRGHDTPRRYDHPMDDPVLPSDDATLNTQI